ncbi:MAG: UDP-N-acetylmuramoyl-L-alanine--D-glutamate ligase [Saprospiraceae bacterium]
MDKQRIVVLGAGTSGVGAAKLAALAGYDVFVSDKGKIADAHQNTLRELGIEFESETHSTERILNAHEVIKSPGIPEKSPLVQAIRQAGISLIGEIEFAWRFIQDKTIVGITGSNGKTTTTTLSYEVLKHAKFPAYMAGNVGDSLAGLVADKWETGFEENAVFVLELSSFQLDDIQAFRPSIAVLLNISPDHLDRYEYQLENYIRSKFRIGMNQQASDVFISNATDVNIQEFIKSNPGAIEAETSWMNLEEVKAGKIDLGADWVFDLNASGLKGPHNFFNVACAIQVAKALGANPVLVGEALQIFRAPNHRMEEVAWRRGVCYINDSKATNVDAVFYALQAMTRPTVWIVGGEDKGNDYGELKVLVSEKVRAIVAMGLDNRKILESFADCGKPMVEAGSAAQAVELAAGFAQEGDAVLLSPACASFDLFKNYIDRGDQFKAAVLELKETELNKN